MILKIYLVFAMLAASVFDSRSKNITQVVLAVSHIELVFCMLGVTF